MFVVQTFLKRHAVVSDTRQPVKKLADREAEPNTRLDVWNLKSAE